MSHLASYASPYNSNDVQQEKKTKQHISSSSSSTSTKKQYPYSSNNNKTHSKTQKVRPYVVDQEKVQSILDQIHQSTEDSDNESENNDNLNNNNNNNENQNQNQNHFENFQTHTFPPRPQLNSKKYHDLYDNNNNDEEDEDDVNNYQKNYLSQHDREEYYKRHSYQEGMTPKKQESDFSSSGNGDLLTRKLNYIIHLLEEQQDEKTNNVTEEKILYMFLGVFIIFIVDSFAKVGKYVR